MKDNNWNTLQQDMKLCCHGVEAPCNGVYYGKNSISGEPIIIDRRQSGLNPNGFVFGTPGSGKSLLSKSEMVQVLLNTKDHVVVIDPEFEYTSLAELLNGKVIFLLLK